jgi:hypothetical protein
MTVLAKASSNLTGRPNELLDSRQPIKNVKTEAEGTVGIRHHATTGEDIAD